MKKLFILIIISFLSTTIYTQTGLTNATEDFVKENIAVLDFTDAANRYIDESKKVRELIENMLVNMKRFNIVDRKNLDKYIEEMKLQYSGITEGDIIEAGKIQGFSKAIYGTIVRYDIINTPPILVTLTDGGLTTKPGYSKVDISVTIKIVDVATSKILFSKVVSGSGITYVDDFIYKKATSQASDDAYNEFIGNLYYQLRNIFKYNIKIADIQKGGSVILLAGESSGVTKGMRFNVYEKGKDLTLSSGKVLSGNYKKVGGIKITSIANDYSIAKITRGNMDVGDIAQETMFGNSFFSIYPVYTAYKVRLDSYTINSDYTSPTVPDGGAINVAAKNNDYSFGIYLKSGYMFNLFSPSFGIGLLFGDMFKTTFATDLRFNLGINIPLYREVLTLELTPFIGLAFTFTEVATVERDYYTSLYNRINRGSNIWKSDLHVGIGSLLTLNYRPIDGFSLSAGVGYKFYGQVTTIDVYRSGSDTDISITPNLDKLKPVNLTGLEALVSLNFFF